MRQIQAFNIRRERMDFEPVNDENWQQVDGRGEALISQSIERAATDRGETTLSMGAMQSALDAAECSDGAAGGSSAAATPKKATVKHLIKKLRWTTIGYEYNWTSKVYEWSRGKVELPPLTYECCRDVVRGVPWDLVFDEKDREETKDWSNWKQTYEPEAGVFNFVSLRQTSDLET